MSKARKILYPAALCLAMLAIIAPIYKTDSLLNKVRNRLKPGLSNKLIIPAQAQDMTSVPFKGWITKEGIAKEGKVNLVLKIYDQANGGTKLYEGVHEAEVTHGQYFAIIQVPSETIANSQLVWLEATSVDEKEVALEPRLSFTARPQAQPAASQHFRYAFLCYSCGGYAFAGSIPAPSGNPAENPAGCFPGPIAIRTDYRPYLCQYPYP